jgi:methionyl-tRNA formyltransferase
MLAQEIAAVEPDDNYFTLSDKLARASAALINQVIADYVAGKITSQPQDESAATYTKIISKADGKVDWQKSAPEIYNQFRAFYIWPGIWTTWNGKKIKITDCSPTKLQMESTTNDYKSGVVLEGGVVVCGNATFLKINQLQLEGKSEVAIGDFLNGYPGFVGSKLE